MPDLVPVDYDPFGGRPISKAGAPFTPPAPDIAGYPAEARSIASHALGIDDAMKAWRGEMTDNEAMNFAFTSALGLIPGARGAGPAEKAAAAAVKVVPPALRSTIAKVFSNGGGLQDLRNLVAKGLQPQSPSITAFHGSAADFPKFDISKVGAGQGQETYGHGLYFAENEKTARYYGDTVGFDKKLPVAMRFGDKRIEMKGRAENLAAEALNDAWNSHPNDHWDYLINGHGLGAFAGRQDVPLFPVVKQILKKWQAQGGEPIRGHMYQVNINAAPEDFLDYDRPLSEQPGVYQKIKDAAGKLYGPLPWDKSKPLVPVPSTTGMQVLQDLARSSEDQSGAAHALREAGIPGIRYLDQLSRQAGKGTHNYVMFDDKLIDIAKKYGIAAALGLGGATAAGKKPAQAAPALAP